MKPYAVGNSECEKLLPNIDYWMKGVLPVTSSRPFRFLLTYKFSVENGFFIFNQKGSHMIEFEEFWKLWPKRVAKKDARKAWAKLSHDEQQAVLDHLPDRITSDPQWHKANGVFIPHPATFLNGERWEDEYDRATPEELKPKVNYWSMSDKELIAECGQRGVSTHGRTRNELISKLESMA